MFDMTLTASEIVIEASELCVLRDVAKAARAYVEELERLCPIRSRVGKALVAALDALGKEEHDGNPTVP